jgi:hypothetical protein
LPTIACQLISKPPEEGRRRRVHRAIVLLVPPVAVTALFWVTSQHTVAPVGIVVALLLAVLPWVSYVQWHGHGRTVLPLFALIASMYWIYYVPGAFWGDWAVPGIWGGGRTLSDETVVEALALALLGVVSLCIGVNIWPQNTSHGASNPDYRWMYVRVILVLGSLLGLYEPGPYLLGEGGRQLLVILQTSVPAVAFALLFRRYLRGQSSGSDQLVLAMYPLFRVLAGLGSGVLGNLAQVGILAGVVYVIERRRIPVVSLTLLLAAVVFLQPAKATVREHDQQVATAEGQIERASFWIANSMEVWTRALVQPQGATWQDLAAQTLGRVTLLAQTSNVLESTPSLVPYQGPHLYSYMLATWIPRAVWPEKPTVNESNQFYQVAYGMTAPENLSQVSIAVGTLTEGYIAFGWLGAMVVMFLLGLFLSILQRTFLDARASPLRIAFGAVLAVQLVNIEAQAAQYVGGMAQHLAVLAVVFIPAVYARRRAHAAANISTRRAVPLASSPSRVIIPAGPGQSVGWQRFPRSGEGSAE